MNTKIAKKLENELKTVRDRYEGQTDSLNRTLKDFVERATAVFTVDMRTETLTVPKDEIVAAVRAVYEQCWHYDTLIYCQTAKRSLREHGDLRQLRGDESITI